MSSNTTFYSRCQTATALANDTGLFVILSVKIIVSTLALTMITKSIKFRYKHTSIQRNLKILIFLVHHFAVYLVCLTNIIPHLYSLIILIIFKINVESCSMIVTTSGTICFIVSSTSLFAIYMLVISVNATTFERIFATFLFRSYESYGISIGVIVTLLSVCWHKFVRNIK